MKQLKSQDINIVMGDFNSKMGIKRAEKIKDHLEWERKMREETDSLNFARTPGSEIIQEGVGHGKAQKKELQIRLTSYYFKNDFETH